MSDATTLDYYRRREEQERALAERAVSAAIRQIHLDLAAHYAAIIAEPRPRQPRLRIATSRG